MAVHKSTLAEQETVYRWDREEQRLHACTANPQEAARWKRLGWHVEVYGYAGGVPRSWHVVGHLDVAALRCRRVTADGHTIKSKGRTGNPNALRVGRETQKRLRETQG